MSLTALRAKGSEAIMFATEVVLLEKYDRNEVFL
jgi:hypothetical protein